MLYQHRNYTIAVTQNRVPSASKLALNKVLGLPSFEIQIKFSFDYVTILGIFLIQTNTFSVFLEY